jgi:hypothetical protein
MDSDFGRLADTFPKYLAPHDTKELFVEIDRFPAINYYSKIDESLLQGDVWTDLNAYVYSSKGIELKPFTWMILSNTCDVAAENYRRLPPSISFAPVVALERYFGLLEGASKEQLDSIERDIRAQKSTGIFFLPKGAEIQQDSVVLLDSVQSMPLSMFTKDEKKVRSAQLSQPAFWVLLIKLSIHFCRAFEGVSRGRQPDG